MKMRLLYLCFLICAFQGNKSSLTKWIITSGCSLKVDGSTNINKFSCVISSYGRPDTISLVRNANKTIALNGSMQLEVHSFDCHNIIMTADLRKTLKASTFPQLGIRFLTMNKYPEAVTKETIKGLVDIELAGVNRQYEVDYTLVAAEKNIITLVGSRQVNFSDFNITPPRKLGGMIKTNNELKVTFTLRMQVIN